MKRMLTALTAVALALSFAPAAMAYTGTNGIGVFLDEAGTQNCVTGVAPYSNLSAYLLAMNIDQPSGLSGWEVTMMTDPATLPAGITYTLNGSGINVLTAPYFQVGLGTALPYASAIKLLTISTFYLGGEIKIGVGPCTPSSFGRPPYETITAGPGYAQGDNPGNLYRLNPVSNVQAGVAGFFWVCYVNPASCPGDLVAVERNSWSGVKTLFK